MKENLSELNQTSPLKPQKPEGPGQMNCTLIDHRCKPRLLFPAKISIIINGKKQDIP